MSSNSLCLYFEYMLPMFDHKSFTVMFTILLQPFIEAWGDSWHSRACLCRRVKSLISIMHSHLRWKLITFVKTKDLIQDNKNCLLVIFFFFLKNHYFALVSTQSTSKTNKFQQNSLSPSHQSDHSPHPLIYSKSILSMVYQILTHEIFSIMSRGC